MIIPYLNNIKFLISKKISDFTSKITKKCELIKLNTKFRHSTLKGIPKNFYLARWIFDCFRIYDNSVFKPLKFFYYQTDF